MDTSSIELILFFLFITLSGFLTASEIAISSFIENLPSLSANLKPIAFGISKVNINTIAEITSRAIINEITAPYSCRKAEPDFTTYRYKLSCE